MPILSDYGCRIIFFPLEMQASCNTPFNTIVSYVQASVLHSNLGIILEVKTNMIKKVI